MTYNQWGDIHCWYCSVCEEVIKDLTDDNCCPGCGSPKSSLDNAFYNPQSDTLIEKDGDQSCTWADPTPEMLKTSEFEAVWQCIKSWDINVQGTYTGYMGATGNHVSAILDALREAGCLESNNDTQHLGD